MDELQRTGVEINSDKYQKNDGKYLSTCTVMECVMRVGGPVQSTQNDSNQNKVCWIILKP